MSFGVLSYLTVAGASPAEHMAVAGAAGFDAITLRAVPSGQLPDQAQDALDAHRNTPTWVPIADVEYADIHAELDVRALEPLLALAAALGARILTTLVTDFDERRATRAFERLCRLAETYGVLVGLEFTAYTAVRSLDQANAMVERVGSPAAVVLVDALHLARTGGTAALVAELASARPERFPALQLCDAITDPAPDGLEGLAREAREDRRLPGSGDLPLEELILALPGAVHYVEAPCRDLAHLSYATRAHRAATALRELQARAA